MIAGEGINPFELSIAIEMFGIPRPELDVEWYRFTLAAATSHVTVRDALFTMSGVAPLDAVADADTVIAPHRPDTDVAPHPDVAAALRDARARGARIVSFCTGAFTLAAAGVIDDHTVTTHWRWSGEFQRRYPHIALRPDVLYVDDGQVLTSAGSAASMDLCLHIIRNDYGAAIANSVSHRLVFPAHREGGQQQFTERPAPPTGGASVQVAMDWARRRLSDAIAVTDLAQRAGMSVATFHRRFLDETGTTPLRWLLAERIDHARSLLETTDLAVGEIATVCGLGTATNLRIHFRRRTSLTPTGYRTNHLSAPAAIEVSSRR